MTALVRADLARDVVIVQGDDAGNFLHSQLAQDVASIPVGGSAHSLLLAPTGHVTALVRVVRHVDTVYTLDVAYLIRFINKNPIFFSYNKISIK